MASDDCLSNREKITIKNYFLVCFHDMIFIEHIMHISIIVTRIERPHIKQNKIYFSFAGLL